VKRRRRPGLFRRIARFFHRRPDERTPEERYDDPPLAGVREPRRPRPTGSAGAATLELPDADTR